jgi:hypothetical protein
VDLESFAATDYILSLDQLEKNYIDREMFAQSDLSTHVPHEEQSQKESRGSCSQYNQFNHVRNENLVICIEFAPTATSVGAERGVELPESVCDERGLTIER